MTAYDQSGESPAVIVVLIHGTFAPDATWTQPDSRLRDATSEALSPLGAVRFFRFEWPGTTLRQFNNSHRIRRAASEQLKEFLVSISQRFSGVPTFIVSHSHGGNVAFSALRGAVNQQMASGVATIATPFIQYRSRSVDQFLASMLEIGTFLTVSMTSIVVAGGISHSLLTWPVMLPLQMFELAIVYWVSTRIRLRPRLRRLAMRIRREHRLVATPRLTDIPKFVAYSHDDEALLWLKIGVAVASLPALVGGLMMIVGYYGALLGGASLWLLGLFLFLVQVPFSRLTRALPLFFGGESLLFNMLGHVSVTPAPPSLGENSLDEKHEYPAVTLVAHSLYESKQLQEDLSKWILGVIEFNRYASKPAAGAHG